MAECNRNQGRQEPHWARHAPRAVGLAADAHPYAEVFREGYALVLRDAPENGLLGSLKCGVVETQALISGDWPPELIPPEVCFTRDLLRRVRHANQSMRDRLVLLLALLGAMRPSWGAEATRPAALLSQASAPLTCEVLCQIADGGRDKARLLGDVAQVLGLGCDTPLHDAPPTQPSMPSGDAFRAWMLVSFLRKTQAEAAAIMEQETRRPCKQPKVSRWLKQVREYVAAGGVMPDGFPTDGDTSPRPKTRSMDPRRLDMRGRTR